MWLMRSDATHATGTRRAGVEPRCVTWRPLYDPWMTQRRRRRNADDCFAWAGALSEAPPVAAPQAKGAVNCSQVGGTAEPERRRRESSPSIAFEGVRTCCGGPVGAAPDRLPAVPRERPASGLAHHCRTTT